MENSYYIPEKKENFLQLNRPIVFFDLETTGTAPLTDRIVEIYAIKIQGGGLEDELHHYINPTIPIPPGATATHGITNETVANEPTFSDKAKELADFFSGCDIAGYNVKRFDLPMLMEEFGRCKLYPINFNDVKVIDAMAIYHQKEKRDLSAAVKFYLEREHESAHSAKADVLATIDILKRQLLLYDDLKPNTSFLHDYVNAGKQVDHSWKFVRDEEGRIVFNFGKHKGLEACTQPGFLEWMLQQDFPVDAKMVAKKIFVHCKWQREIQEWLEQGKILKTKELASALYTTARFGEGIFPFKITREGKSIVISYLNEPPLQYQFANNNALKILLNQLEVYFKEQY